MLLLYSFIMPTEKTRINLTVSLSVEQNLKRIAKRDKRSVSTVALDLLERALDIEEDYQLQAVADVREKEKATFVSHANAWG